MPMRLCLVLTHVQCCIWCIPPSGLQPTPTSCSCVVCIIIDPPYVPETCTPETQSLPLSYYCVLCEARRGESAERHRHLPPARARPYNIRPLLPAWNSRVPCFSVRTDYVRNAMLPSSWQKRSSAASGCMYQRHVDTECYLEVALLQIKKNNRPPSMQGESNINDIFLHVTKRCVGSLRHMASHRS
ncbi:uncharacterized protein MYCFIDRAFT_84102 [Pseudocercospora fijiensis CIRAD86]|uniref:Secreted protein n=1 Tax=Pseudocercospora fijiensis (strain CIRAD86) TaxID=383855 RepID=M2ZXX4_PSEFD|nr:uncharacterized protein MYCFIDRAFT_84102 [Pseudocercospora fijiensis CIRAD86]EME83794.1 hypothetical protein MYCFIDRAFT_84102 [Pseudocercospora fijiensis CIRAD86]